MCVCVCFINVTKYLCIETITFDLEFDNKASLNLLFLFKKYFRGRRFENLIAELINFYIQFSLFIKSTEFILLLKKQNTLYYHFFPSEYVHITTLGLWDYC